MTKILLVIGTVLMSWSSSAMARETLAVGACAADVRKLCPSVQPGNHRIWGCLEEHMKDLSGPCVPTLARFAEVRGFRKECKAHLKQECASVKADEGEVRCRQPERCL